MKGSLRRQGIPEAERGCLTGEYTIVAVVVAFGEVWGVA